MFFGFLFLEDVGIVVMYFFCCFGLCWIFRFLQFDFYIDVGGEIEFYQCVNCLWGWVYDVEEVFVGVYFELFVVFFVNVG